MPCVVDLAQAKTPTLTGGGPSSLIVEVHGVLYTYERVSSVPTLMSVVLVPVFLRRVSSFFECFSLVSSMPCVWRPATLVRDVNLLLLYRLPKTFDPFRTCVIEYIL